MTRSEAKAWCNRLAKNIHHDDLDHLNDEEWDMLEDRVISWMGQELPAMARGEVMAAIQCEMI